MGLEDSNRLPRLHQHGLVVFEVGEGLHHGIETGPVASGLAVSAIDNELVRVLGNRWIEIVVQHAKCCLLLPALGGKCASS